MFCSAKIDFVSLCVWYSSTIYESQKCLGSALSSFLLSDHTLSGEIFVFILLKAQVVSAVLVFTGSTRKNLEQSSTATSKYLTP